MGGVSSRGVAGVVRGFPFGRGYCFLAVLFAAAGRHPLAGIAAAFAGVSGGFSANITPGQLDALLLGITQTAVDSSGIVENYSVNIAGNW